MLVTTRTHTPARPRSHARLHTHLIPCTYSAFITSRCTQALVVQLQALQALNVQPQAHIENARSIVQAHILQPQALILEQQTPNRIP